MYDMSLRTRGEHGRFTSDKTGLSLQTAEQKKEYQRSWGNGPRRQRLNERQYTINLMKAGVGCSVCGTKSGRLDFHHRGDEKKLFNVSQRLLFPWSRLMSEIFKCNILCVSCHTRLHMKDSV
jgi:hypothetical protein